MVENGGVVYYSEKGSACKIKARVVDIHFNFGKGLRQVYDIVTIEKDRRYLVDISRGMLEKDICD